MQQVLILAGPASEEDQAAIAAFAASKGWRVSVTYTTEVVGGEHRLFDPTPLGECTSLDTANEATLRRWKEHTLADVQRMTLMVAWRRFGGRTRSGNGKAFRGGTQFIQICAAMRTRGLRFADADAPHGFYTVRQWCDEFNVSSRAASMLVAGQVHGPAHLHAFGEMVEAFNGEKSNPSDDLAYDVIDLCGGGKLYDEIIALTTRIKAHK